MTKDTKDKLFDALGYLFTGMIILAIVGACVYNKRLEIQRDKEREERAEMREQQEKAKEDSISKAQAKKSIKSAKYIYVDVKGVLHIDRNCVVLLTGNEEPDYNSGVARLMMEDLTVDMLSNCCSSCIDDDEYEQLLDLAK